MDDGRIRAAMPGDISRLDEGSISPRPLESGSDVSLPHRATIESTTSQTPTANHATTSSETVMALTKLPGEVIEL